MSNSKREALKQLDGQENTSGRIINDHHHDAVMSLEDDLRFVDEQLDAEAQEAGKPLYRLQVSGDDGQNWETVHQSYDTAQVVRKIAQIDLAQFHRGQEAKEIDKPTVAQFAAIIDGMAGER